MLRNGLSRTNRGTVLACLDAPRHYSARTQVSALRAGRQAAWIAVKTHHFITEARTLALLAEAGFGDVERFFTAFLTAGWLARKR